MLNRSGQLTLPRTPSTKAAPSPVSRSYSSVSTSAMAAAVAGTSSSYNSPGFHTPPPGAGSRHHQASRSSTATAGYTPGAGRAAAGTPGIKAARVTAGSSPATPSGPNTGGGRLSGAGVARGTAGRQSGTTKLLSAILNGSNAMHTVATLGSNRCVKMGWF